MYTSRSLRALLFTTILDTASAKLPTAAPKAGCSYNVPQVGSFNTHLSVDFTLQKTLPDFLHVNTYTIQPAGDPFARQFEISNVALPESDQAISLSVDASNAGAVRSAEIQTMSKNYLYGSVRTVAKVSSPAGTTNGIFFYHGTDTYLTEIDIEICTNAKNVIHYTNQPPTTAQKDINATISREQNMDLSQAYHEYRIDWLPGITRFYFDGRLQATLRKNVPTQPAAFVWNNWSSGNSWSGGPPVSTGAMKIRSIDAYLNDTTLGCGSS